MIDVGAKPVTRRVADRRAAASTPRPRSSRSSAPTGCRRPTCCATARIAGIAGAKRTSELIPLAHIAAARRGDDRLRLRRATRSTIRATVSVDGAHRRRDGGAHRRRHRRAHAARHGQGRRPARGSATSACSRSAAASAGVWRADAASDGCPRRPSRRRSDIRDSRHRARRRRPAPPRARAEDTTGPLIVDWLQRARVRHRRAGRRRRRRRRRRACRRAVAGSPPCSSPRAAPACIRGDRTPEATRAVLDRSCPASPRRSARAGRAATPTAALSRARRRGRRRHDRREPARLARRRARRPRACSTTLLAHLLDQVARRRPWLIADVFALVTDRAARPRGDRGRSSRSRQDGALVIFEGVIRDHDHGASVTRSTTRRTPMRERFLRETCAEVAGDRACASPPRTASASLVVGDVALVASVAAPHRAEAFAACARLVDRIKERTPIWKRQHLAERRDGVGQPLSRRRSATSQRQRRDPPPRPSARTDAVTRRQPARGTAEHRGLSRPRTAAARRRVRRAVRSRSRCTTPSTRNDPVAARVPSLRRSARRARRAGRRRWRRRTSSVSSARPGGLGGGREVAHGPHVSHRSRPSSASGARSPRSSMPWPACLPHMAARHRSAIVASSAPPRSSPRRSVSSSPNRHERTVPSAVRRVRSHAAQNERVTEAMMPTVAGPPSTSHSSAGADGSSRPTGVEHEALAEHARAARPASTMLSRRQVSSASSGICSMKRSRQSVLDGPREQGGRVVRGSRA